MQYTDNKTEKRIYQQPHIELILLDNEISLALESSPPIGPDEVYLNQPNQLGLRNPNDNPFA